MIFCFSFSRRAILFHVPFLFAQVALHRGTISSSISRLATLEAPISCRFTFLLAAYARYRSNACHPAIVQLMSLFQLSNQIYEYIDEVHRNLLRKTTFFAYSQHLICILFDRFTRFILSGRQQVVVIHRVFLRWETLHYLDLETFPIAHCILAPLQPQLSTTTEI